MVTGALSRLESYRRRAKAGYKQRRHDTKECREKQRARSKEITSKINPCYLKEARAMLEGKDTKGKNKCCPLPGD